MKEKTAEGISFITCSRDKKLFSKLKKNINLNIGIKNYEIIPIDNSKNQYSLASAYNKGISMAKFPILCFLHEDARFLTKNFGKIIISKFSTNPEIAALGIAGSAYLPEDPVWFSPGRPFTKGQVVHKLNRGEQLEKYSAIREDTEVVVLDGVFIAARKDLASKFQFDEQTFNGFHFYDIDFTLRIAEKHKIIVTFDFLLQHLSAGSFNESWKGYKEKFIKKHRNLLPYTNLDSIPKATHAWKSCPYDSEKDYPKVLVGCPTSFHKEHCLQQYAEAVASLTYPNYDILLIDNSPDDKYLEKIRQFEIPAIKGPYFDSARDRIVASRNILREYAIKNNYDYLLSLEQDVIPPKDVIERMLIHNKQVISGIYFNRELVNQGLTLVPLAYSKSKEVPGQLPSMKPLNKQELWSNKLLQTVSAGLGCLLIHKEVLKKVKFRYDKDKPAFDDRFFFIDLYNLKIPSFTDTSIKCKHFILNRPYQWKDIQK